MISRKHQQGLTLFELLIVVIIAAVLIGMLLPVAPGNHRRKARNVLCLNNLRQTTLTLAFYAQDNTKGFTKGFPNLDQQAGNDGPAALLLVTNYARTPTIFMCPYVVRQRTTVVDRAFFQSNGNDYAYYDGLRTNSFTNAIMADRYACADRSSIEKKLLNHPDRGINIGFVDCHAEHVRPNLLIGTNYTPAWSSSQDPLRLP